MPTRRVVGSPLAKRETPVARPHWRRLYKLQAWVDGSRAFLAENPYCRECQKAGRTEVATDTDHIIPHRGNLELFWDRANWQPLCHSHHSKKTKRGE